MKRKEIFGKFVLIGIVSIFLSGCLCVEVFDNVKNPRRYFRDAYREISRIHRSRRYRRAVPKQIHILVYERSERKIVRITTPVWMVDACTDLDQWIDEGRDEFDLKIRYDFDRRKLRNLKHKRPGLLVDIKDKGDKVLIWLD